MQPIEIAPEADPRFEDLLEFLKRHRGFDFTNYQRRSLVRRINGRMHAVGIRDYSTYREYLQKNPGEFPELFNAILISVTSFFRDAAAWRFLADEMLPRMLASRATDAPIRVWSAGCASGEETFTAAIILAEILGLQPFSERVTIYGTDVDEHALDCARTARYSAGDVARVGPELVHRYFEKSDGDFMVRHELRSRVTFRRQELVAGAPMTQLDLIVCRNTLMYFTGETQTSILATFHSALVDDGILFLGSADALPKVSGKFEVVEGERRILTKVR